MTNPFIYHMMRLFLGELYHLIKKMVYTGCSTFFFLCLLIADHGQARGKKGLAFFMSILAYGGLGVVLLALSFRQILPLDTVSYRTGKFLFLGFSVLSLIYVLFIEIPVRTQFSPPAERCVSRSGSYGIVRHPGFYPFLLLVVSLYLFHPNPWFFSTGISLVLLNFFTIYLEDRFLFPRIFRDYNDYKSCVPFILPRGKRKGR